MTDMEYNEYLDNMDDQALRNLRNFSRFMARMIDKYGEKALNELKGELKEQEGEGTPDHHE